MFLFLQIALLVLGVALTIAVLMQHGKSYGLSGTIAGGAETFFGKDKGGRMDKLFSRATTIIGIVFVVLALLTFMMQPGGHTTKLENMSFSSFADNYNSTSDLATENNTGADTGNTENHDGHEH